MIGGRAERAREWFRPGPIGVSSRSGGMTSAIAYYLTRAGIGQSTIVHVGGDADRRPVPSRGHGALRARPGDARGRGMFGEIGTTQEERVADLIERGRFTKPLIAYIGGKAAKSGTRFSHAGAIVEGTRGLLRDQGERLQAGRRPCRRGDLRHPQGGGRNRTELRASQGRTDMSDEKWKTAITDVQPNNVLLRGYPIDELMGRISFAQAIYLVLTGELPSPEVGKLLDAIFVSSIDHGAEPAVRPDRADGRLDRARAQRRRRPRACWPSAAPRRGRRRGPARSSWRSPAGPTGQERSAEGGRPADPRGDEGQGRAGLGLRPPHPHQGPADGEALRPGRGARTWPAGTSRIARRSRSCSPSSRTSPCRSTSTAPSPPCSATSASRPRSGTPSSSSPACPGSSPTSTRRRRG